MTHYIFASIILENENKILKDVVYSNGIIIS